MRIHHVAMRTADVGRLEKFYAGVLGLAVVRRDETRGSVWLAVGDAVLMLERAEDGEAGVTRGTKELLAFAVEDVARWETRVAVEGRTEHTLYFRDPDGRRVAVSDYAL